jgi:hypothetical protein
LIEGEVFVIESVLLLVVFTIDAGMEEFFFPTLGIG